MTRILIIDDEIQMRRLLRLVLESRDYEVYEAAEGQLGLQQAALLRPDVVLLDLGLPDMSGQQVLLRLREWSDVPVLVLSVRDEEAGKVEALENGADDYVTKPFSTAELLARIQVIRRRCYTRQSSEITAGEISVDLLHHEAKVGDKVLKLTPTEFSLLRVLVEHAGRIVTQRRIMEKVWAGLQSDGSEALRVHINHLRKKLGDSGAKIVNEPGIGYRLECE